MKDGLRLRLLRLRSTKPKPMIARVECSTYGLTCGLLSLVKVTYGMTFKTLDSYPLGPIASAGKRHESENPCSASDHISRCSIASSDSSSVRCKPSSRTRQPFHRPIWGRGMHVCPSNPASQPSISQRQGRTCRPVISLSPNTPHSLTIQQTFFHRLTVLFSTLFFFGIQNLARSDNGPC